MPVFAETMEPVVTSVALMNVRVGRGTRGVTVRLRPRTVPLSLATVVPHALNLNPAIDALVFRVSLASTVKQTSMSVHRIPV